MNSSIWGAARAANQCHFPAGGQVLEGGLCQQQQGQDAVPPSNWRDMVADTVETTNTASSPMNQGVLSSQHQQFQQGQLFVSQHSPPISPSSHPQYQGQQVSGGPPPQGYYQDTPQHGGYGNTSFPSWQGPAETSQGLLSPTSTMPTINSNLSVESFDDRTDRYAGMEAQEQQQQQQQQQQTRQQPLPQQAQRQQMVMQGERSFANPEPSTHRLSTMSMGGFIPRDNMSAAGGHQHMERSYTMGGAVAGNVSHRTVSQPQPLSSAMSVGYNSPPRSTNAMTNSTVVPRQQQGVDVYDTGRSPAMPQSLDPPQQRQESSPALRLLMSDTDLEDEDVRAQGQDGYGNTMYQGQTPQQSQQLQRQNMQMQPPPRQQYYQPQPQRGNEAMEMDPRQMQQPYGPVVKGQAQVNALGAQPQASQARMPEDFGSSNAPTREYETRHPAPRDGPPFDSNVQPRPTTSHHPNDMNHEPGTNRRASLSNTSQMQSSQQSSQQPEPQHQRQAQQQQSTLSSQPPYPRVDPNPSSLGYYAQAANSPTSPGSPGYRTFAA